MRSISRCTVRVIDVRVGIHGGHAVGHRRRHQQHVILRDLHPLVLEGLLHVPHKEHQRRVQPQGLLDAVVQELHVVERVEVQQPWFGEGETSAAVLPLSQCVQNCCCRFIFVKPSLNGSPVFQVSFRFNLAGLIALKLLCSEQLSSWSSLICCLPPSHVHTGYPWVIAFDLYIYNPKVVALFKSSNSHATIATCSEAP